MLRLLANESQTGTVIINSRIKMYDKNLQMENSKVLKNDACDKTLHMIL